MTYFGPTLKMVWMHWPVMSRSMTDDAEAPPACCDAPLSLSDDVKKAEWWHAQSSEAASWSQKRDQCSRSVSPASQHCRGLGGGKIKTSRRGFFSVFFFFFNFSPLLRTMDALTVHEMLNSTEVSALLCKWGVSNLSGCGEPSRVSSADMGVKGIDSSSTSFQLTLFQLLERRRPARNCAWRTPALTQQQNRSHASDLHIRGQSKTLHVKKKKKKKFTVA